MIWLATKSVSTYCSLEVDLWYIEAMGADEFDGFLNVGSATNVLSS